MMTKAEYIALCEEGGMQRQEAIRAYLSYIDPVAKEIRLAEIKEREANAKEREANAKVQEANAKMQEANAKVREA